jgi:effector-binding domain-containing protein
MPEQIDLQPELVAGLRADVAAEDLGEFFGSAVATAIPPSLLAGPVTAIYHRDDTTRFDVTIGFTVSADPGDPTLSVVALPGGPALRVVHHGEYQRLGEAYAELRAGLAARGVAWSFAWERYLVGPADGVDPSAFVTELTHPLP